MRRTRLIASYTFGFLQLDGARFGDRALDAALQTDRVRAKYAIKLFAIFEDDHRWNGLDAIAIWSALVLVNVHFGESYLAIILVAEFLIDGGNCATRRTPGSPEVNYDRFVRFEYLCFEICISNMEQVGMIYHITAYLTFMYCIYIQVTDLLTS